MYAIIDVGSNTVRMNFYKFVDGKFSLVMGKKESVGLASYVKNGQMLPEGINRACAVLGEFRTILGDLGVTNYHVFATAALRNAANSRAAVEEIMQRTGMYVEVLSGELEAELDFIGTSHAVDIRDGLLIDIGGASTELVVYKNGDIKKKVSLPIGSLNTYDRFVMNLLPSRAERKAIKQAVLTLLKEDADLNYGTYKMVCGVGGTVRAARKLNNFLFQLPSSNMRIKVPNIKKMIKLLESEEPDAVPVETLEVLLKVVPDRVMTILPGMIILQTVVKHFKSEWVDVTRAGVRDGYLYRYVLAEATQPKVLTAGSSSGDVIECEGEVMNDAGHQAENREGI
ncbi:MAG: phosphatase [Selenomonadaceae bacterium]